MEIVKTEASKATNTKRIVRGWMNLKVVKIVDETWDTKSIYLINQEQNERAFDYDAGQYLTFRFDNVADKPIVRSYTMSSSPCDPGPACVTVKRVEGGLISNWFCDQLKEGDILRARGPIGAFRYQEEDHSFNKLVMVAGGSGVTPFVSIMREILHRSQNQQTRLQPKDLYLLVSYRSDQDLISYKELCEFSDLGATVAITLSRQDLQPKFLHGRIDENFLAKHLPPLVADTQYMTCGPDAIMKTFENYLAKNNVDKKYVKTESFTS